MNKYSRAHKLCLEIGAANNTPCWVCAGSIRYRSDGAVHYVTPIANGGDALAQSNMAPIHKRCVPPTNSRKW